MLSLTLCFLGLGWAPSALAPAPVHASVRSLEAYAALLAEFEAATLEWRAALKKADRERRLELRADPPAKQFLPRFEALGEQGEGRAWLWIIENVRDTGLAPSEFERRTDAAFERLVAAHVDAPWFGDVLELVARRKRGGAEARQLYERVRTTTAVAGTKTHATYLLGRALLDSQVEEEFERGEALLREALAHGGDAAWVQQARTALEKASLRPGRPAPDFEARTIEGQTFKLSDFRGKVVLLDFYGFW